MKHRPELDGLRGVAVLTVLASHAQVPGFSIEGGLAGVLLHLTARAGRSARDGAERRGQLGDCSRRPVDGSCRAVRSGRQAAASGSPGEVRLSEQGRRAGVAGSCADSRSPRRDEGCDRRGRPGQDRPSSGRAPVRRSSHNIGTRARRISSATVSLMAAETSGSTGRSGSDDMLYPMLAQSVRARGAGAADMGRRIIVGARRVR